MSNEEQFEDYLEKVCALCDTIERRPDAIERYARAIVALEQIAEEDFPAEIDV